MLKQLSTTAAAEVAASTESRVRMLKLLSMMLASVMHGFLHSLAVALAEEESHDEELRHAALPRLDLQHAMLH
jgi:hypothetical protein